MLETLVAGLQVLQDEAVPLGLEVNWTKTKIQHIGNHVWPSWGSRWQQRMSTWWTRLSTSGRWSHTMEEVRPKKFCDASGSQGSASPSLRRTSGGLIYSQTLRCTSTGPTSFQSCSMGARHGLSARPWQSASMPSTPGVCRKFYGFHTPGTLQMIQSGASRAACQSLKRPSRSDWGFSGTWLDQLQRRTITVSSPPCCDHHLTGGDLLAVQDPPG